VYRIELVTVLGYVFQSIGQDELKRIERSRHDIDAYHIESGAGVASCRATFAAE
jgi:hypothetical protein